ncbi:MAG: ABC transporter ATP-binding protein [Clostridia bacterium]|nr:ABC transporter ATP-binding protein [Clostridia bacterium]
MNAIRTEKLTKFYGKVCGIKDLDLVVERGDFFGFIGPNGSGKSTTIRTLLGLISPTFGSASILERDIIKDRNDILSRVGYMPSEAVFYNGMRVAEILSFSAALRKKDCSKEAKKLCERLQLDPSRKVEELSFGNRKKVGIVCALQHLPELLILDEPTSGLDPLMQWEFFEILHERNRAGATVFLSSHVLSEIQHNCNRAAIIREGRLIACDCVENLSKTSAKRVKVRGKFNLSALSGVRDVQPLSEGVSFLYGGDVNELIRALSAEHIGDLTIAEPDLEEIFMHYYTNGGEAR